MRQIISVTGCLLLLAGPVFAQGVTGRVPSTPLLPHDPYFSIWSASDSLFSDWPRHWTGATHGMTALLRIDGKPYRLMGRAPRGVPPAVQTGRQVTPTQTSYTFSAGGVRCILSFRTPQIPWNADLLSRPVAFVKWELEAVDGLTHDAAVYFDISAEVTVNTPDQNVTWGRFALPGLDVVRLGSQDQEVLGKKGDNLRIDWGYLYLAAEQSAGITLGIQGHNTSRSGFAGTGTITPVDDLRSPRQANDDWPVLALAQAVPGVAASTKGGGVLLAYDDVFAIQYFNRNLPAFWRRGGKGAADLLAEAAAERLRLEEMCVGFDAEFTKDARQAGGEEYVDLAVLAYRQCLAANKIVADIDGTMLMFPKENFSNGCIGTVDVIYPASPMFLLLNPSLLRAQLQPLLEYAALPRWKFPFAPHDLGTYPHANGQVYGGGELTEENQMPVEESGNMLLMVAGLALAEGSSQFAIDHWNVLTRWAEYLKEKGFDPENQLCTDDFAGHLAHNVNLSAKAILALGAYAKLCEMTGKNRVANIYRALAEGFVREWVRQAADGDHTRLAFDKSGTWSQKYNLIWDRLLELNLFPRDVVEKEMRYYLTKQNTYGLPLDSRREYTKLDWILWTASLSGREEDFRAFVSPIVKFLRETPDRVPMTDWYWTTSGKQVGFQARSVVGGVLVKMLLDRQMADRWRKRVQ